MTFLNIDNASNLPSGVGQVGTGDLKSYYELLKSIVEAQEQLLHNMDVADCDDNKEAEGMVAPIEDLKKSIYTSLDPIMASKSELNDAIHNELKALHGSLGGVGDLKTTLSKFLVDPLVDIKSHAVDVWNEPVGCGTGVVQAEPDEPGCVVEAGSDTNAFVAAKKALFTFVKDKMGDTDLTTLVGPIEEAKMSLLDGLVVEPGADIADQLATSLLELAKAKIFADTAGEERDEGFKAKYIKDFEKAMLELKDPLKGSLKWSVVEPILAAKESAMTAILNTPKMAVMGAKDASTEALNVAIDQFSGHLAAAIRAVGMGKKSAKKSLYTYLLSPLKNLDDSIQDGLEFVAANKDVVHDVSQQLVEIPVEAIKQKVGVVKDELSAPIADMAFSVKNEIKDYVIEPLVAKARIINTITGGLDDSLDTVGEITDGMKDKVGYFVGHARDTVKGGFGQYVKEPVETVHANLRSRMESVGKTVGEPLFEIQNKLQHTVNDAIVPLRDGVHDFVLTPLADVKEQLRSGLDRSPLAYNLAAMVKDVAEQTDRFHQTAFRPLKLTAPTYPKEGCIVDEAPEAGCAVDEVPEAGCAVVTTTTTEAPTEGCYVSEVIEGCGL